MLRTNSVSSPGRFSRWLLVAGVLGLAYALLPALARVDCLSYVTRPDVLFVVAIGGLSGAALLGAALGRLPTGIFLEIPMGLLAGISIVPSLPLLLCVVFTGIGIAYGLRSSMRVTALVLLVGSMAIGYVGVYAMVALVPAAVSVCR
jgi:hypothetical protein